MATVLSGRSELDKGDLSRVGYAASLAASWFGRDLLSVGQELVRNLDAAGFRIVRKPDGQTYGKGINPKIIDGTATEIHVATGRKEVDDQNKVDFEAACQKAVDYPEADPGSLELVAQVLEHLFAAA